MAWCETNDISNCDCILHFDMEKAPDPLKEVLAKKAMQIIRAGNGDELRKLLIAGADPSVAPTSGIKNEATNTLLYHAVAKQDVALVKILLDYGADINGSKAEGFPPLRAAVVRNNAALIKLLLARGADVNHRYTIVNGTRKETKTLLFEVASINTYELLLKNGADVHVKNSWHETPLHFQAYNWSSRLVRALISAGADVNAVNKKNTRPLDNAIFRKPSQRKSDDDEFMEVCRVLLRHKAIVSWSDPDQYFKSKGKPDSDPSAIKARLQLVHEWECQRKKGNTSFKLPIEVFRRGALDIATYYSALNRGGCGRDSIVIQPDGEVVAESNKSTEHRTLESVLRNFGGLNEADHSDDDIEAGNLLSRTMDENILKVLDEPSSTISESFHSTNEVKETRVIGGGSYSPVTASKAIRGGSQSAEAVEGNYKLLGGASAKTIKNKRSKGKAVEEGNTATQTAPKTIRGGSPRVKVMRGSSTHAGARNGTIDCSPETRSELVLRAIGGGQCFTEQAAEPADATDYCDSPETSPVRAHRVITGGSCRSQSEVKKAESKSENLLYRCKVCVVGPSRWGKTSFIKSFTSGSPTLESTDVRTIGIDLFPWSFDVETEAGDCEYQVSFWDFAGQEEYRAAHTLFYSSRTLYLLCINLERYYKAITAATDSMDQTVDDRMMDAFAEMHIFRWVRMICAHHPQAEFVFLGTKADLIQHDRRKVATIQQDLVGRFKSYIRRMKDRLQRALQELQDARFEIQDSDASAETTELDDQIASCEQILRKQPVILSEELIVFSSADMKDESIARGKLKALLMMSGSSVLLPPSYAELLKHAQEHCVSGSKLQSSFQDKVDTAFLSVPEFINSIIWSSKLIITKDEILAALHLLHDTGDIVWFDGVSDVQLLQERIFLDPMLVIEFIRQIVNHKVVAKAGVNGYLSHVQLQSLPFWKEVSTTTIQQLKELLLHLHLAYSAGKSKRMSWNSDLIVPVYWNRDPQASTNLKTFPAEEDTAAGLIEWVRWEYSFEPAIPENLFEKLAVATYSPLLRSERRYAGSSFIDEMTNEFRTRVSKEDDAPNVSADGDMDVIASVLSISVAARERTLAWKQLVWYCMNLENLLRTYPGLLITRCTVSHRGQRFNVDQLLSDQEHFTQLNICTDQEYLPADMEWYTNKSRCLKSVTDTSKTNYVLGSGVPSDNLLAAQMAQLQQDVHKLVTTVEKQSDSIEEQFQQNGEHIDAAVNKIQRSQISLITGMKNKAKFPSLWTLEYQGFEDATSSRTVASSLVTSMQRKVTTTVVIKFRSDLSGKCHHEPIAISAAKEVFSRFGKHMKVGLTLLSAAAPDFCGKDILRIITEECQRQLDRSMDFHEVLHRTGVAEDPDMRPHHMEENRELSPSEILTLLSCLLRLHSKNFKADDIPQLSGLACGVVVKTGEYIWASRYEIHEFGRDIVLAVDYSPRGGAASIEEIAPAEVPPAVEAPPPVPTEMLPPVVPVPPQHGSPAESSSKLNSHEDGIGTKGVLQAMRRRLSSSKAAVPTTEVQRYMLKIAGAKGLHGGRKQKPYCICRFDTPRGETLLQIQTSPHSSDGQNPSWSSQLFEVALPISAARNTTILFMIKLGSVVGSSQIAQGRIPFVELKPGQSTSQEVCLTKKDKPAGILEFSLEAFA